MNQANRSVGTARGAAARAAISGGPAARPNTFGRNLRVARRRKGISQDDLARGSGVDRTAISTYERGRREPNLRTIVRLAQALEIAPAELLRHM